MFEFFDDIDTEPCECGAGAIYRADEDGVLRCVVCHGVHPDYADVELEDEGEE